MQYQIKLDMNMDANSLNTLLGALGSGPHNFVRPIIDNVLAQAKEQEEAAKAAQEEITEQTTEAGLTD
jgi:FMN-dependent NADH-azoreductase